MVERHRVTAAKVRRVHAVGKDSPARGEVTDCLTCANGLALQHHAVEDEADVLGGLRGARALFAQQVQDLRGEHRMLAVLDELAQVGQARLFALRILLDDADDAVHDGPLVLEATLRGGGGMAFVSLKSCEVQHTHTTGLFVISLHHL